MSQPEKSAYWVRPCGLVDLPVHAGIGAADVAEGPRRQEGVVERRVEGVEQRFGTAADADPAQSLVPALAGQAPDLAEAAAAALGGEVGASAVDADEGDADPGGDGRGSYGCRSWRRRRPGRSCAGWRSASGCLPPPGRRGRASSPPGAGGIEAAVEDGGEVDPVARPLTAEEAAGGGPGDFAPVGVDRDRRLVVGLGAAAGVDEDAGVRIRAGTRSGRSRSASSPSARRRCRRRRRG